MEMVQVYSVWSLNVSASQTLQYKKFGIRISSVKTVPTCLRKLKVFFNKFNIDVSSLLMSSLRAIVICQNIAEIV